MFIGFMCRLYFINFVFGFVQIKLATSQSYNRCANYKLIYSTLLFSDEWWWSRSDASP